jgi:membrane associated rhomboid family serine protease
VTADDRKTQDAGDPLQTETPSRQPILNAPPVIGWLLALIGIVSAARWLAPPAIDHWMIEFLAFDSSVYTDAAARAAKPLSVVLGPVTHALLHGGPMHLAINMAMLLAFGTPIARRMGALWFLSFFILCTVAGAAFWLLVHPTSAALLVGASGGISGLMGAVVRLGLARRPMPGGPAPFRNRQTAVTFAIAWIVLNFVFGAFGGDLLGIDAQIAWEAHLGGFLAGLLLMGRFDARGRVNTKER